MLKKSEIVSQLGSKTYSAIIEKNFSDLFNITSNDIPLSEYPNPPKSLVANTYKGLIYACLDVRAESVSQVKWRLYRNGREVDMSDDIYSLLRKPNPLFTWSQFIYLLQTYYDMFGEVYIYINKNRRLKNKPVELWILPSQYVVPVFDVKQPNVISHFELTYFTNNGTTTNKMTFSTKEVVYYKSPNPKNPARGIGRLELALLENDIHFFSKTYVRNFYKNGAVPQGILTTEKTLNATEIERLRNLWYNEYGGTSKSWKVAILFGGLKYEKLSTNPASQDFISQAQWSRDDILSIFKVPPVMLGVDVNSRATAEVQEKIFARQTVKPLISKLEEMINFQLLPTMGAVNYKFEFDNPIPQDMELNIQRAKVASTFGVATINEIRQMLGLDELKDDIGNQLVEPLNNPQGRPTNQDRNPQNEAKKEITKELIDFINQIDRGINAD